MNRTITHAAAVVAFAIAGLLTNAAAAEPLNSPSAPVGCTGDYVCGDDPSVVTAWPLERWETVRKARQHAIARAAEHARLHGLTKQSPSAPLPQ